MSVNGPPQIGESGEEILGNLPNKNAQLLGLGEAFRLELLVMRMLV